MLRESSQKRVLISEPSEGFALCCTASDVLCTVGHYAAAKKEEEELKTQKRSSQASSLQQQQGGEVHPTSSSDQPKAASTSSSVAGSISLAAWSHQGIAEKAKEVVSSRMPCLCFMRLESYIQAASAASFCI